jgi:hypothetical protein
MEGDTTALQTNCVAITPICDLLARNVLKKLRQTLSVCLRCLACSQTPKYSRSTQDNETGGTIIDGLKKGDEKNNENNTNDNDSSISQEPTAMLFGRRGSEP